MIYFDCNATVPLHPEARRAWLDVVDQAWHNPSGLYSAATAARDILDDCRERLAGIIDCDPARIVFTGGATAATNMVARHLGLASPPDTTVFVSAIEHPCITEAFLAAMPRQVVEIPVDPHGVVRPDTIAAMLRDSPCRPAVTAIMAASNESGTLQPWSELAAVSHRHGVPLLVDAAQWFGKLPARGLGECDWVVGSGHKFGGPKGVGFLVIPAGRATFRGDRGGPQEGGRHAGTEDVASIAGMVAALVAREQDLAVGSEARSAARDAAERHLRERLGAAVIVGQAAPRMWNTLAVVIPGADAKKLIAHLNRAGIAASTGSACSTGEGSFPRVLTAIGPAALGLNESDLRGMVRLSAGWDTSAADWIAAADALIAAAHDVAAGLPRVSLSGRR